MKKLSIKSAIIILIIQALFIVNELSAQTNFIYGKQIGTEFEDMAFKPIADNAGNVYLAGSTEGKLSDRDAAKADAFVSKFDSLGNTIWTKQFGTQEDDKVNWAAIDNNSNLVITGQTKGAFNDKNYGNEDVFITKMDIEGNIIWTKQYGTDSTDIARSICTDEQGNIYVAGFTKGNFESTNNGKNDGFLLKLNPDGDKLFVKQFGSKETDQCNDVTTDNESNIYIIGLTWGDMAEKNKGLMDIIVKKFNKDGKQISSYQIGTETYDMGAQIKVDNKGNMYLGCSTAGDFAGKQQGEGDCLLVKLNRKGEILWSRQFGTPKWDGINGLDLNEKISDKIVISGCQNYPQCESFCRVYDKEGNMLWEGNYVASGKDGGTCGKSISLSNSGFIYHTGLTGGNLFNTAKGKHDVYLLKLKLDKSLKKK